jgi:hypothetical protein
MRFPFVETSSDEIPFLGWRRKKVPLRRSIPEGTKARASHSPIIEISGG